MMLKKLLIAAVTVQESESRPAGRSVTRSMACIMQTARLRVRDRMSHETDTHAAIDPSRNDPSQL